MTEQAFHAVRAVELEPQIGARMARKYARNRGVFQLYLLARLLHRENMQRNAV